MNELPANFDPNATDVCVVNNPGLTSLPELPNATVVTINDCPSLVENWIATRLTPLLTATGKTVEEVVATGCWECHEWANCPMHVVFGVNSVESVPKQWRSQAAIFVHLFDSRLIPCPVAKQAV